MQLCISYFRNITCCLREHVHCCSIYLLCLTICSGNTICCNNKYYDRNWWQCQNQLLGFGCKHLKSNYLTQRTLKHAWVCEKISRAFCLSTSSSFQLSAHLYILTRWQAMISNLFRIRQPPGRGNILDLCPLALHYFRARDAPVYSLRKQNMAVKQRFWYLRCN